MAAQPAGQDGANGELIQENPTKLFLTCISVEPVEPSLAGQTLTLSGESLVRYSATDCSG